MKRFIKQLLREAIDIPSFRLPKKTSVTPEEITAIKNLNWSDIKLDDLGGTGKIAHLKVSFPFESSISDGIVVDIQIINNNIYQIHMHMSDSLHGLGLGYKIHKAIIMDFGHLYCGKGRILNPLITKIWDRLKNDTDIECVSNENGDLCVNKSNPNKNELFNFMG